MAVQWAEVGFVVRARGDDGDKAVDGGIKPRPIVHHEGEAVPVMAGLISLAR